MSLIFITFIYVFLLFYLVHDNYVFFSPINASIDSLIDRFIWLIRCLLCSLFVATLSTSIKFYHLPYINIYDVFILITAFPILSSHLILHHHLLFIYLTICICVYIGDGYHSYCLTIHSGSYSICFRISNKSIYEETLLEERNLIYGVTKSRDDKIDTSIPCILLSPISTHSIIFIYNQPSIHPYIYVCKSVCILWNHASYHMHSTHASITSRSWYWRKFN